DDFGRQLVRPQDLLNRWIDPLEKRIDYLTLKTGKKIEVPFDQLIIFTTNLDPEGFLDESFLRRIPYKIEVGNPTFDQYREIFKGICETRGVPYCEDMLRYLLRKHYVEAKRELRSCHPRDIIDQIGAIAQYRRVPPSLQEDLIDQACRAYFVKL
ncbi:MAG: ATP-binding protein, partial [Chloroflexi bacterium]|nr:ATP-binding protein [Chloroflexota bacterium]